MTSQIGLSESLKPFNSMLSTLEIHVHEKRLLANNIFRDKPILNNECVGTQKREYIEKYCMIARIKQIGKICEYVNKNYNKMFSFHNNIIKLLNVINKKRYEYITSIDEYKCSKRLSKSEKKILNLAKDQIKKNPPKMSIEIGNVLNRLFIKDVALYICEYI